MRALQRVVTGIQEHAAKALLNHKHAAGARQDALSRDLKEHAVTRTSSAEPCSLPGSARHHACVARVAEASIPALVRTHMARGGSPSR